jgi:hypothetical protein
MDLLKKLTTLLMAALLATALSVSCASSDDDDDDNDDDATEIDCSDFTTQDDCEENDECAWEFPDDATDASLYATAATEDDDDDDDNDDDDAGECVAIDEEDDDDDDDDNDDDDVDPLIALCAGACDDMITCGYAETADDCADDCESQELYFMGATVAADLDVLDVFAACMVELTDTCDDSGYDIWDCADEACCFDEASATACGLDLGDCGL